MATTHEDSIVPAVPGNPTLHATPDHKHRDTVALPTDGIDISDQTILKSRLDNLSRWETVKLFRRVWGYCFLIYTLNSIDGWQISVAGAIIVNKGFIKQFATGVDKDGNPEIAKSWISAWGAIINVGQFISAWFLPQVANRFGRKAAFYCCLLSYAICLAFLTAAKSPAVWLIGKLFVGVAAGSAQYTTGAYMVEIAPNRIRGSISAFQGLWGGITGILCSAMLQITNQRHPDFYLLPIYVCWGLAGLMTLAISIVPESPWYYGRHGKKEQCIKAMKRLYGNIQGFDYDEEWTIIEKTLQHEREVLADQNAMPWKELFVGRNKYRTLIINCYAFAQHWGGLALIGTYGTYFFATAGFDDPFLASLILSCIGLATTIVYSLIIDKVGRRPLVIPCYAFCSASLWLIGALYYSHSAATQRALLVITAIWQVSFGVATGPYGLMCSEIPSAHLRIKTNAFLGIGPVPSAIASTFAVPQILDVLDIRAGFVFGATSLPFLIILALLLPETKGRAAAEIDELWERKIPAWRWAKTETYVEQQMRAVVAVDAAKGHVEHDDDKNA